MARADVLRRRCEWFEGQPDLEPERLIFIDETWTSTKMARTRGRAPRGERLHVAIPHGHWKTTTFVAGLRSTGVVTPMALDGPINGIAFQAYVEQVPVPELMPGETVVIDNLGSHKGGCGRGDRGYRCQAALPAALFPRLQSDRERLRHRAESPAAQGRRAQRRGPVAAIGIAVAIFSPQDCANSFANAGYISDPA